MQRLPIYLEISGEELVSAYRHFHPDYTPKGNAQACIDDLVELWNTSTHPRGFTEVEQLGQYEIARRSSFCEDAFPKIEETGGEDFAKEAVGMLNDEIQASTLRHGFTPYVIKTLDQDMHSVLKEVLDGTSVVAENEDIYKYTTSLLTTKLHHFVDVFGLDQSYKNQALLYTISAERVIRGSPDMEKIWFLYEVSKLHIGKRNIH